jgi:DNA-binding transcriptional regulator GbsR (MarR family)
MAHTRKDTFVAPPEWWKHLRPFNKRKLAKRERRAAAESIKQISRNENETHSTPD